MIGYLLKQVALFIYVENDRMFVNDQLNETRNHPCIKKRVTIKNEIDKSATLFVNEQPF